MSFQPLVGGGGYSGWRLLTRTLDAQKSMVARDPVIVRENNHVQEKIGSLTSVDELMADFRLLKTTLSAFGLEADLGKKAFIRKVLESDVQDSASFANRLSDKRYRAMAEAFNFSRDTKRSSSLAGDVIQRHVSAELERRIGTVDGNMRLALNASRELGAIGHSTSSDNTRWYTILGSLPLRKVFEGALGLGSAFGRLPIERQLAELKIRTEKLTGSHSPSSFADPATVEKVIQRFLLRADAATTAQSSYGAALILLR